MAKGANYSSVSIYIRDVEKVEVKIQGDKIRLFAPEFSLYISVDEINELVDKIGKTLLDRVPQPFIRR